MISKKLDFGLTCAFTGHRVIPNDQKEMLIEKLDDIIDELTERNFRHFICGGALGFDMLAEQALIKKKKTNDILLEIAVPCANQSAKWNEKQKRLYDEILKNADKVTVLFDRYVTGCMHFRDAYMVDNSDALVAYYRGKPGGTQYTFMYAENRGIEVINL